jgi:hypothetical protein
VTDRNLRADQLAHAARAAGQPQPDLREQLRRAIAEGGRWDFDSLEPHDFQDETTAVLAVVRPLLDAQQGDTEQLRFLHALLALSSRIDLGEQLMLHTDGQRIHASVNISDVFWWGGADSEDVTPETLPALEQAYTDLRAVDPYDDMYTAELYAARLRGMRPQGAAYPKERAATQALFDACGPERPTGLGNPHKPPVPKEPT